MRHPDAIRPFPYKWHSNCAIVVRPGEISVAEGAALDRRAITMKHESTPLWVWLTVALLVVGAVTYITSVYFIEYVLTFF